MSGTTDRMEHRVDGLRDALREQARDMHSSLDQVTQKAESVAATFRMHEHALLEAANEATLKAEELRLAQVDTSRGVFLRTVNHVLDSLGSVGVDLDRAFEGALSPDVLKRYGKGDIMAAVRRVASRSKDPIAVARVRELFEEDEEFRTLAMRYMREFERLLSQAGDADPDDLLSASLLTADVGKAYMLMSRAIDRYSK